MLKFARRRARSSEREPVKCVVMNNSLVKPRASSAERVRQSPTDSGLSSSDSSRETVTVPKLTPSRVEARTASIQKAAPRRNCLFEDSETDLPAYSMSVSGGRDVGDHGGGAEMGSPMTVTVSQLTHKLGQVQVNQEVAGGTNSSTLTRKQHIFTPPPALPKKPMMLHQQQRHLWKIELLDTSAESGYGTDNSDNNSLKSVNSTEDSSPPPCLNLLCEPA